VEAVSANTAELRKGDVVEVRSAAEILATLDERGEHDAMPFMPEMVALCGRRFTVVARAERVCDTINGGLMARSMTNTVVLDGTTCDGSGHGGCAAACLIYWKEAWLRRIGDAAADTRSPAPNDGGRDHLLAVSMRNAKSGDGGESVRFRCQATQANDASVPVSTKDPRPYLRSYTSGNVTVGHFARVMSRAVVMEVARKLRLLPEPAVRGESESSTRTPALGLQPGEWVRVKSREEIEATLNNKGKNRGLWFDREMLEFCGQVFQVRHRVDRLVDERTGEMIELSSDCVALEGATCS